MRLIINQDLKADAPLQQLRQYFNIPYQSEVIAQDQEGDVRAWEKKRQDPNAAGRNHAVPVNYGEVHLISIEIRYASLRKQQCNPIGYSMSFTGKLDLARTDVTQGLIHKAMTQTDHRIKLLWLLRHVTLEGL